FMMWFVLSEQSRYIVALAVPLSVLAGGAVLRLPAGKFLAAAILVQALVSFWVVKTMRFDQQVQVVTGKLSADDYRRASISFYEPARYLNQVVGKTGRVALYDEVFGFLLDVPYIWANPGHSNELGYDWMASGDDLGKNFSSQGITHVYVHIQSPNDPETQRWLLTTGLTGPVQPYTRRERDDHWDDLNWRSKALIGQAIAIGWLRVDKTFGPSRIVFRVDESAQTVSHPRSIGRP
ncbi:MAG: hypothetical protein ACHQ50_08755, partial [Fimbriimonadales bacterium]